MKKVLKVSSYVFLCFILSCTNVTHSNYTMTKEEKVVLNWECIDYIWEEDISHPNTIVGKIKIQNLSGDTLLYFNKGVGNSFTIYNFCRGKDTLVLLSSAYKAENDYGKVGKIPPYKEVIKFLRVKKILSKKHTAKYFSPSFFDLVDSILLEGTMYYTPPIDNFKMSLPDNVHIIPKMKVNTSSSNCTYDNSRKSNWN